MAPLRVGFVREHFSSPLLQLAEADAGKTFTLVSCPSGTGQIISRLTNDEIDIAIALTDPLIAGIAKGSTAYKLVGSYVKTPLNWAIVTGKDSSYKSIADLRGTTIGISRIGSGSHTMASVMALQQGWADKATGSVEHIDFKINNDIDGLNASVNDGSTSAYLWEWFTTKPWADKGEVRFIGSVPTPWPSWMIAAHPERASPNAVEQFLTSLTQYVREFDSESSRTSRNIDFIKDKFGYGEQDIKAWLATVGYYNDTAQVEADVLFNTLDVLVRAGVVARSDFQSSTFVDERVARVVPRTQ